MDIEKVKDLLTEANALYECYIKLDKWHETASDIREKEAANAGRLAVEAKLLSILCSDEIIL